MRVLTVEIVLREQSGRSARQTHTGVGDAAVRICVSVRVRVCAHIRKVINTIVAMLGALWTDV